MSIQIITPTSLPPETATLYSGDTNAPPVAGWYPDTEGPYNFTPSLGGAVIINSVISDTLPNIYHAYYYSINNKGYFRAKFDISFVGDYLSLPIVHDSDGYLWAAFITLPAAGSFDYLLYRSNDTYDISSGDVGAISIGLPETGTLIYDIYATDAGPRTEVNFIAMPLGGILASGFAIWYKSTTDFWNVFFNLEDNQLYILASSAENPGTNIVPWISLSSSIQNSGPTSYTSLAYSDWSTYPYQLAMLSFQPAQDAPLEPQVMLWLDITDPHLLDSFSRQMFYPIGNDGNSFGAISAYPGLPLSIYEFYYADQTYKQIRLVPGDAITNDFINNWNIKPSIYFYGYSPIDNTPLFITGDTMETPFTLFSLLPTKNVSIMGPGPIIPAISIPCGNYCIPLKRVIKL